MYTYVKRYVNDKGTPCFSNIVNYEPYSCVCTYVRKCCVLDFYRMAITVHMYICMYVLCIVQ